MFTTTMVDEETKINGIVLMNMLLGSKKMLQAY
jgi:hypothetical protein